MTDDAGFGSPQARTLAPIVLVVVPRWIIAVADPLSKKRGTCSSWLEREGWNRTNHLRDGKPGVFLIRRSARRTVTLPVSTGVIKEPKDSMTGHSV
jgi:hypothetical protein